MALWEESKSDSKKESERKKTTRQRIRHGNLVKFSHLIYLFRPMCKKDGLNEQHCAPKFAFL